jgi:hypothetical protein
MNKTAETWALPRWMRSWEQFWFTPADPSVLGLIRVTCGMIVLYTLFAYSFSLQDMMGERSWQDLPMRMNTVRNLPVSAGPFSWQGPELLPEPQTEFQTAYLARFKAEFNDMVPLPPYPRDQAEADAIIKYYKEEGQDPRRIYARGMRIFSLWFHVLDPETMAVLHTLVVVSAFLMTIGFCTRLTSALTWFGTLSYIHRNNTMLFGVDTMITILLLYLMIGPSGAAYSVDNLIRRWWARAKPGVVQSWFRFWRRPIPTLDEIAPARTPDIVPSLSANVAIRLLQINVGIIYFVSGLSKLQGTAWWNGEAVWGTLGNFEFAPMQFQIYLDFLAFIGQHRWLYALIMTGGGLFTLAFEIGYIFLIWRPRLRWVFLSGAIVLHGMISLFMGLGTFALVMLVMNMAFLRTEEVQWLVSWFGVGSADAPTKAATPAPPLKPAGAIATAIKR